MAGSTWTECSLTFWLDLELELDTRTHILYMYCSHTHICNRSSWPKDHRMLVTINFDPVGACFHFQFTFFVFGHTWPIVYLKVPCLQIPMADPSQAGQMAVARRLARWSVGLIMAFRRFLIRTSVYLNRFKCCLHYLWENSLRNLEICFQHVSNIASICIRAIVVFLFE